MARGQCNPTNINDYQSPNRIIHLRLHCPRLQEPDMITFAENIRQTRVNKDYVYKKEPPRTLVFLQSCNYFRCWRGQRVRKVASVHVPQEYKNVNEACRNSTSYDIAVIELQQNADSKPICMPQKNDAVPQKVKSIGHGNYEGDDSIQAVTFVKTSEEPENNAIVAYTEYKNEAIIGGDSGGPLVHEQDGKHYLLGISSSSNDLTPEMRIGMDYIEVGPATVSSRFVDVRKHLGWICDITGVCEDGDGDFEEQEPPSFAGLE
ncbi:unnamed protein product [Cylicocyclus nassatus]|uniref:Peptidase S1 domain-containing protein n=1 Tax=Cylicocyclus nassatus TaxID=53992 RepID=A0AA36GKZ3_CYLNA|nr:unnamed protein product [Cylicocyclus nassatus]